MSKYFLNKKMENITEFILFIFGIYLLFQIIRKIFGGSWSTEDIVISLLVFNLGSVFTLGLLMTQLKADHSNLKTQFNSLVRDFKSPTKASKI